MEQWILEAVSIQSQMGVNIEGDKKETHETGASNE